MSYTPLALFDDVNIRGPAGAVHVFRVTSWEAGMLGILLNDPTAYKIDAAPYSALPATTIDWDPCSHYLGDGWVCTGGEPIDHFVRIKLLRNYAGNLSAYLASPF